MSEHAAMMIWIVLLFFFVYLALANIEDKLSELLKRDRSDAPPEQLKEKKEK